MTRCAIFQVTMNTTDRELFGEENKLVRAMAGKLTLQYFLSIFCHLLEVQHEPNVILL
jgi:hypothetical protein